MHILFVIAKDNKIYQLFINWSDYFLDIFIGAMSIYLKLYCLFNVQLNHLYFIKYSNMELDGGQKNFKYCFKNVFNLVK